jgi:hypothetical protein
MFKESDPARVALTPCPAISNQVSALKSITLAMKYFMCYAHCTCLLDVVFPQGWAILASVLWLIVDFYADPDPGYQVNAGPNYDLGLTKTR